MMKQTTAKTFSILIMATFTFASCSKEISEDELPERKFFTEGVIELGVFQNEVDLSFLFDKIDFSEEDGSDQFDALLNQHPDQKTYFENLKRMRENMDLNYSIPLLSARNIKIYLKDGNMFMHVLGMGWQMKQHLDVENDAFSLLLESFLPESWLMYNSEYSAKADVETYVNRSESSGSLFALSYDRIVGTGTAEVAGYHCQIATYTIKPDYLSQLPPNSIVSRKIVAYTTAAFPAMLRYGLPLSVKETEAVIKMEVYYNDSQQPTFVIQPKRIEKRTVTDEEMKLDLKNPVLDLNTPVLNAANQYYILAGWSYVGI